MYAVLSDIHANLEALRAVLADMREHGARQVLALGDFVGFCGNPAECVDTVRPLLTAAVGGNHEAALFHRDYFGIPMFDRMIERTLTMLTPSQAEWLRTLPATAAGDGWHLVHAPQDRPGHWLRIRSTADAARVLAATTAHAVFFGHTHAATAFCMQGGCVQAIPVEYDAQGSFIIRMVPGARYLVNPGSVGYPRDCDWRAAYALYSPQERCIRLRRLPYDVETACAKVTRTGLPAEFGDCLRRGAEHARMPQGIAEQA